jgi:hypothetical protein
MIYVDPVDSSGRIYFPVGVSTQRDTTTRKYAIQTTVIHLLLFSLWIQTYGKA